MSFKDYHAAEPFPLAAYACRATDTLVDFCHDLGLSVSTTRQWAYKGLVPWSVYEAARKRYGPLGFGTPPKVRHTRPFRLPNRFDVPPIPLPAEPVSPPVPVPVTDLLRITARLDEEKQRRDVLEAKVRLLEQALAKQAPAPVPFPVLESPPTRRVTLENALKTRNGQTTNWLVTNRAEHEFAHLSPDDQKRHLKVLDKVVTATDWHGLGRRVIPNKQFREPDLWCFRAGKGRLLVARQGPLRRIVALPARSDKTVFSREI